MKNSLVKNMNLLPKNTSSAVAKKKPKLFTKLKKTATKKARFFFNKPSNKQDLPPIEVEMKSDWIKQNKNLKELEQGIVSKKKFDELDDEKQIKASLSALEIIKMKNNLQSIKQKNFIKNDEMFKEAIQLKDRFIKSQIKDIFDKKIETFINSKMIRVHLEEEIMLDVDDLPTFKKRRDDFIGNLKFYIDEVKRIANKEKNMKFMNLDEWKNEKNIKNLHIVLEELETAQHYNKNFLTIFLGPGKNIDNLIKLKLETERQLIKRGINFFKYTRKNNSLEEANDIVGTSNNKKLKDVKDEYIFKALQQNYKFLDSNLVFTNYFQFVRGFGFNKYTIFGKPVKIEKLSDIDYDDKKRLNAFFKHMDEGINKKKHADIVEKEYLTQNLWDEDERRAMQITKTRTGRRNEPDMINVMSASMINPTYGMMAQGFNFLGGGLKNIDHFTNTPIVTSPSTYTENYVDKILNSTLMKKIDQKNNDNNFSLLIIVKNIYDELNENLREKFLYSENDEMIKYLIEVHNSIVEENQEEDSLIKKYKEIVSIHNNNNKFINILFIIITIIILLFIIIFLKN